MTVETATDTSVQFLEWLAQWQKDLPTATLERPESSAVVVVDMVNGFCKTGNLSGERVGNLIAPIVSLLREAESAGVTRFLIAEDTHRPDDREFSAFPPHCISGSGEEKTVDEIVSLPFANQFEIFDKPTVNISVGTSMDERLSQYIEQGVDTFVVVGDCTDLCVYQAGSFLRFATNGRNVKARVIIAASAVDTYDLPMATAEAVGALPHPGDLMHSVFLYHLALIGCEVVSNVQWRPAD